MNSLITTMKFTLPVLIVIFMGVLIYSPAAKYDFVWDDEVHIVKNAYDTDIAEQGLEKYWLPHPKLLYAPLTYSIWALAKNFSLNEYGVLRPGIFHQLNIIFHLVNTILIYLILLRLKLSRTGVFFGIIIFCFHPLQVEAVCWTSAFRTVFCGFWSFLSVYLYLLYLQCRRANLIYYLSAFLCFGAALLSKPLAVILPLFLIFISRHIRKESFLSALTRLIPFLIVSAIAIIFTMNNGEPVLNEIKP
ncbi:MAG: hypothetical protein JW996_00590, partial [Candidatus Cloacimonetes bacterium]|nr:hypothetical protein [Candidatus Cloacimonadota bacterium]